MPSYRLSGTVDRSDWLSKYPRMTAHQVAQVSQSLIGALGAQAVLTNRDQLLAYSYDATGERHWPDLVVIPENAQQVQRVLELTHRYRAPIVGRGSSTNLSGGTTPLVGGVVVSFARMNKVLEISEEERWVRVEPGVVNADLAKVLNSRGFFYPPDPSSHRISTLGGNLAENAGGPHCVKYGVTTHHVLSLQIVLADGRSVELPRVADTSEGIDVASLIVGSEGTLGLVTQAVLAIYPQPALAKTLLASFRRLDDAVKTASSIVAKKVRPSALELMDRESIRVVESFVHAGYPADAEAVLLIELDGSFDEVESGVAAVQEICHSHEATNLQVADSAEEAEKFWRGRRAHYGATALLAPHLWVQDVTVPRPRLAEMMTRVQAIAREQRLVIVTAAHAGDGNLHPNIPYNPADADEVGRMKSADRSILEACVAMGGSITGEHGVGIDKAEHLPLMYSPWELEAMEQVKAAFDPAGTMNPLKALWPPGPRPANGPLPEQRPTEIVSESQLQDAMHWSHSHSEPLVIRGAERRSVAQSPTHWVVAMTHFDQLHDLDLDNLSVEVGAGYSAGNLARLLALEGVEVPGLEPFMDDTVGGLIAANAPFWRHSDGHGWRDWVLAVQWVDARGRILRFGRKTMKNVAGYDLVKLMVGSGGRLGAITRVTLRLRPREEWVNVARSDLMSVDEAVNVVDRTLGRSDRPEGMLVVRRPGDVGVRLWFAGNLAKKSLRVRLSDQVPATLTFEDGEDAWLRMEQERLHRVYQAAKQNTYVNGRVPLGQRDYTALLGGADGYTFYCPGAGWYEMIGETFRPLGTQGKNPEVARLRERVARVFDPEQLLL